ncbi:MAG: hypothetical protein LBV15_00790 [Planctomycetota bacterium]|jgi:hypothetical protein|nr:hypothetical protein [Planctomycetota bacterium]
MPGRAESLLELFLGTGYLLWAAAALAFVLLILLEPVAEIWIGRRRDVSARLMRAVLFILVLGLEAVPPFLIAWESGAAVFFQVLFFPIFCYFLGKRTGWDAGRDHLSELLGVESRVGLEEAQDRLFESGMRFASRAEVVKSITDLVKAREETRAGAEREPNKRLRVKTKTIDLSK